MKDEQIKPTNETIGLLAKELKDAEWNVKYHADELKAYEGKVTVLRVLIAAMEIGE